MMKHGVVQMLIRKRVSRVFCAIVMTMLCIAAGYADAFAAIGFKGTATDLAGTAKANIQVSVTQFPNCYVLTDASGNYTYDDSSTLYTNDGGSCSALAAGTYYVMFTNPAAPAGENAQIYYKNKLTSQAASADPVAVVAGVVTSGIDAKFGTWGTISGKVIDNATSAVISGVQVNVCDQNGAVLSNIPSVVTDANGNFIAGLVPAGTYKLKFSGANYLDQTSAWTVTAGAGTGINTLAPNTLLVRSQITGKVTNLTGTGIAGIWVYLLTSDKSGNFYDNFTGVQTLADGTYKIGGIAAGQCVVQFDDANKVYSDSTHKHYYNNQTSLGAADIITVATNSTTSGINAALASNVKPAITGFSAPATSSSTTLTGITLTASGSNGVTGYLITESSTAPLYTASGWSATAPTSYTASNSGVITLYPWAKDSTNLVSAVYGSPQTVTITLPSNGICGSANGGSFSVAPTTNLCSTGTASSVTGTGPWSWTCAGTNGGTTASCSASVLVVDTTPPALTVSTLLDGATTNNPVLNVSGIVSDVGGLKSLTVKGQTVDPALITASGFFSKAVVLNSGANTVAIVATDNANNVTTITRTITYSSSAPLLTVDTPADVSTTNQAAITVSGTVDATATNVTVTVRNAVDATTSTTSAAPGSGTYSFSNIPLTAGGNTVDIVATTPSGTSTAKRTVIYNSSQPSLAVTAGVTNPAQTITQDFTTTKVNITLNGTVSSDVTGVSISVSGPYITTQTYTPAIAGNAFTQTIALSSVQTYTIAVTATGTGTAAILRNIVFRPGDCNGDGKVTLGEARTAINQYFSPSSPPQCIDLDENGSVSLGEARKAINSYFGL
ncbi:hypothetical protein F6V30_02455 [Oryzomonas sagensis]|uniref:Uncharacterized protein n=1 Tax=Oryzomonas sagensis TaxID=2603857 RepID=A0ABQ6TR35_9BACT|nr:carboxypeptidase regulatory-like domain-containing protein [Oryzomonas sagensis]KAB0671461.1 hypothetical protein F6V30_02455 [Oryzomonas sagensis]